MFEYCMIIVIINNEMLVDEILWAQLFVASCRVQL